MKNPLAHAESARSRQTNSAESGETRFASAALCGSLNPLSDGQLAAAFRAVVEEAVDGIITISPDGIIQTVNQATQGIFGYRSDELVGQNIKMLMPEPYHSEHDSYLQNYRETGQKKVIGIGREVVGRRKDGSTFPLNLAVSEVSVGGRRLFAGTIRDISEPKALELRYQAAILEREALITLERLEFHKNAAFKAVIAEAVDGIISINQIGTIETVNKATERIFGYSSDELVGKNIKMLMPEPYHSEHDGYLRNYKTTGDKKIIGIGREVFGRRKDGTTFPLDLAVSEVNVAGRTLFTGTVRDISERKDADAAMAHLASIVESSNDTIISKTLDGIVTSWNKAAEKLFGFSAAEMIGENISKVVPPDLAAEELEILRRIQRGEGFQHYETVRLTKYGKSVGVAITVSPIQDSSGKIVGASKILRDISDRLEKERRVLQELENLKDAAVLKSFVEATPDAFITIDDHGTMQEVNPATERMFGYSASELRGKNVRTLMPEPFKSEHEAYLKNYRETGVKKIIGIGREVVGRRKNGSTFPLDLTVSEVALEGRRMFAGTIRDITERKKQEGVLARLAAVVESSTDAVYSMNTDFIIQTWNAGATRIYGYKSKEVIGKSATILAHEPLVQERSKILDGLFRGEALVNFETTHRTKKGEPVEVAISVSPIADGSGQITAFAAVSRDVTERKRADAARAYLAAMVESSNDAIMGTDLEGVVRSWNSGAFRLFGYAPKQVIGKSIGIIMPIDSEGEAAQIDAATRGGESIPGHDGIRIAKGGRAIEVELSSTPILDAKGAIVGTCRVARDISERKAQQKALFESENQFKTLAETMPLMMWGATPDGQIDYINSRNRDFIGRDLEEIQSKGWGDLVHPDDLLAAVADHEDRVHRQLARDGELRLRRADGKYLWFKSVIIPILDDSGNVSRWYGLLVDIHDQKEVANLLEFKVSERTAELERANHELDAFAYSVSHDLRSPLRHIDGFIELLQRRIGDGLDEKAAHYLEVIADSAGHMGALIDDLLDFSRMSRSEVNKSKVNFNKLIHQVIDGLNIDSNVRSIEWKIEQLPPVHADPSLMKMVWANLIQNAAKFTSKKREAQIEIGSREEPNGSRTFFIKDNGVGFDMEYAHKLFGVFQRLHRSDEFEGTGIGLANVSRIVQRHGGTVGAKGVPGEGATFHFTLPEIQEEHE